VARPIDGRRMAAGRHEAIWDAGNVSSGRYAYRLTVGGKVLARTAVVTR
jgi:hypothetical protein